MSEWKDYLLIDIANIVMGQSSKSEFYNENGSEMPFLLERNGISL